MGPAMQSPWSESIVFRHHPMGASTGYMDDLRGDWRKQIAKAREVSPFAIELSALSEAELPSLIAFLTHESSLPFRYVSVHGPSKGRRLAEEQLVEELLVIAPYVSAIVMHPDTIERPRLFRALGHKLLLENMDKRKEVGTNRRDLEALFTELPEAGFCFDIAHAWSIDPHMAVANELLDVFGRRLRHVHLSSLSHDLHHIPLRPEDEALFGPTLQRCLDVPWIFEAPPRGIA
ncbi:MAG: TIM barrel protein [Solirubrobacterales bacterium]